MAEELAAIVRALAIERWPPDDQAYLISHILVGCGSGSNGMKEKDDDSQLLSIGEMVRHGQGLTAIVQQFAENINAFHEEQRQTLEKEILGIISTSKTGQISTALPNETVPLIIADAGVVSEMEVDESLPSAHSLSATLAADTTVGSNETDKQITVANIVKVKSANAPRAPVKSTPIETLARSSNLPTKTTTTTTTSSSSSSLFLLSSSSHSSTVSSGLVVAKSSSSKTLFASDINGSSDKIHRNIKRAAATPPTADRSGSFSSRKIFLPEQNEPLIIPLSDSENDEQIYWRPDKQTFAAQTAAGRKRIKTSINNGAGINSSSGGGSLSGNNLSNSGTAQTAKNLKLKLLETEMELLRARIAAQEMKQQQRQREATSLAVVDKTAANPKLLAIIDEFLLDCLTEESTADEAAQISTADSSAKTSRYWQDWADKTRLKPSPVESSPSSSLGGTLVGKPAGRRSDLMDLSYQSPLECFQSFIFSDDFHLQAAANRTASGVQSENPTIHKYLNKIQPNRLLCIYETTGGVCEDRTCTSQHFRDLPMSPEE